MNINTTIHRILTALTGLLWLYALLNLDITTTIFIGILFVFTIFYPRLIHPGVMGITGYEIEKSKGGATG